MQLAKTIQKYTLPSEDKTVTVGTSGLSAENVAVSQSATEKDDPTV